MLETILVTGGAGYIGSHVVKALGEKGYRVVVYDNLSTGRRESVLYGDLVVGDLADRALLDSVVADRRPQAVMHFAANIEVAESVRNPIKYYCNNTANAISLLNVLTRRGVGNFIFSSTAAVYGDPLKMPIEEDQELRPVNPYGQSKAFVEKVLADLSSAAGFRYAALRYFNAAGADPAGRIGEMHDPESHLIPLVLKAAKGERESIRVYGSDYPTPDGTCIRDYVHVEDLAEAHLLALRHLLDGKGSDVFNCGYGLGYSVRQVIEASKKITGVDLRVDEEDRRPGDPPVLVAGSGKIREVLDWIPKHDSLEHIISTAWEWERKR